jgi:hypothetical protein
VGVEPEDPAVVERLIPYVMRATVALERVEYVETAICALKNRLGK